MPKKKSRKSRTSQGLVGSPKKARTSLGMERLLNQVDAWRKGKRVYLSVPNPVSQDKSKSHIKMTGRDYWGLPPSERKKQQQQKES